MDALRASYGDASSDSDSDIDSTPRQPPPPTIATATATAHTQPPAPLPPPPISLLEPSNSLGTVDFLQSVQPNRIRSFPHVEGNFALHVYIPVHVPSTARKGLVQFLKRVVAIVPGLNVIDIDIPLSHLDINDQKFEQVVLSREFHVSLARTVPIRVHQRDSIVSMLQQKLQFQKRDRYVIDFNKWEVFVNDDRTRTFLSIEVTAGGLPEITRQINAVNEVYRLHNLPEFYKDPRPHISIAWALGDISDVLRKVVEEEAKSYTMVSNSSKKSIFTCKFSGIVCKIGNKIHEICKIQGE